MYLISDKDLGYQVEISKEELEDPTLDLIGWYMQHLTRRGQFCWSSDLASLPEGEDPTSPTREDHACPQ